MNVLVVYASRHGATAGIAHAIGKALREHGITAAVRTPGEVGTLACYDAVVAGSAIYMGQWLKAAREFAERNRSQLEAMPVWLFSSGPVGDPPFPRDESEPVAKLASTLNARDCKTFAGKLDREELGLVEELMTAALRAPQGDFRDWTAIRDWADSIAAELTETAAATGGKHV